MASYSQNQLSGKGTPIEALTSGTTYTFTLSPSSNYSGSFYFTFETDRNSVGFYDTSISKYTLGTFENFNNTLSLVSSSYIFSIVSKQNGGSFQFTPSQDIPASGSFLRTTGGATLVIS